MRGIYSLLVLTVASVVSFSESRCWRRAYVNDLDYQFKRDCAEDKEFDSGFCFNKCLPGYYGRGEYCIQYCPDGFPESADTLNCWKPKQYIRAPKYHILDNGEEICKRENYQIGCEQYNDYWYLKCQEGFRVVETDWCVANCKNGQIDGADHCKKVVYKRTAGCKYNYQSIDPHICW
jgi:hypothetical protein